MEIWKKIPGIREAVEASSLGRIRRLAGVYHTTFRGNPVTRQIEEKILLCNHPSTKGYLRHSIDGSVVFAHRLVALAFIENPESLPQVNHLNGIKTDNRPENLEWSTNQNNRDHAVATGLQPVGSRVSKKLTEADIPKIREQAAAGKPQGEIGADFGVCQQTISHIVSRNTWRHVRDKKHDSCS